MRNASGRAIGEKELAEMNASVEASLALGDDDWADAVAAAEAECAMLCGSLALTTADIDFE